MTFGIIGYGRFGKLWAQSIAPYGDVRVYDPAVMRIDEEGIELVALETAVQCDILFLLVPISRIERVCQDIVEFLAKETLVVDACSVKVYPVDVMSRVLAKDQAIIATHPLFGPDSVARDGMKGQRMVVCPVRASDEYQALFAELLEALELKVIETTPDDHDRQMARSQALVHFLGRGMDSLDLHEQDIATPDYISLLHIDNLVNNDTWELFYDMQVYNPYATYMRRSLMESMNRIDRDIAKRRDDMQT